MAIEPSETDQAPKPFHRLYSRSEAESVRGRNLFVTSSTIHALTGMLLLICAMAAASCGGDLSTSEAESEPATDPDPWSIVEASVDSRWLPVLATQDLAVGVKRVAFSLNGLGADEAPSTVRVSLFRLDGAGGDATMPRTVQYAQFRPYDPDVRITAHGHVGSTVSERSLPIGRGVYVTPVQFDQPGLWGMLLEMSDGESAETVRLRFSVRARQAAPGVGEQALSTSSRTRTDVDSLAELTSDPNPEPGLYALSFDEALAMPRPLLLAFATPAFCHSRTCAPVLESVKAVWRSFADEISGIHVEVFENPQEPSRLAESEAFAAWRLPSEPWVFVIDRDGRIRYSFEGAVTEAELRSAVEWVIQDGS